MIEGNTALAIFRVETYLRTSPQMAYYRDDMISAALLGVCKAVDDMQSQGSSQASKTYRIHHEGC